MILQKNIIMFSGLCLVFLLTGCGERKSDSPASVPPQKKAPLVIATPVLQNEIVRAIQLNGTIEPYRVARLASPAEGPVLKLRAREGDLVPAGKYLLSIGRKQGVSAMIDSFSEELEKEEDNLNRTRRLVESAALPGEELDKALASVEKVKSDLASAMESKRDYQIRAPFSGLVSRLLVSEGDFVSPHTTLAEMYDPATLVLRAAVNERSAAVLKMDMPADISLDAYPNRRFTGKISRLYPYLDIRTRTRTIEIDIVAPPDLLPGMFGRVRLALESIPNAITVPVNALLVTPKGGAVAFVVNNGKAIQRKVTTGIENNGRLQILSGVSPGEQVIVSGHEKLKDGMKIRVSSPKGNKNGKAAETPSDKEQHGKSKAGDL